MLLEAPQNPMNNEEWISRSGPFSVCTHNHEGKWLKEEIYILTVNLYSYSKFCLTGNCGSFRTENNYC